MKLKQRSSLIAIFCLTCHFVTGQDLKEDQFSIARTVGAIWQYVDAFPEGKIDYTLFECNGARICRLKANGVDIFLLAQTGKSRFRLTTLKVAMEGENFAICDGIKFKKTSHWVGAQPIYD